MVTTILSVVSLCFIAAPASQPVFQHVQGPVTYVDEDAPFGGDGQSWATAYKYLQDALQHGGQTIHLAEGTYKPDMSEASPTTPGERSETFTIDSSQTLVGGFAGLNSADPDFQDPSFYVTRISGDLASNDPGILIPSSINPDGPHHQDRIDNSYRIFEISEGSGFTASGLTITASYGENGGSGGAIYKPNGPEGFINLSQCVLIGNYAEWGGAIYARGPLMATDCIFSKNASASSGGAIYTTYSYYCDDPDPYWYNPCNCYYTTGSVTLDRCTFKENHSLLGSGGGLAGRGTQLWIYSSLFDSNFASIDGAGVAMYGSSLSPDVCQCFNSGGQSTYVSGCTFTNNVAGEEGANLYVTHSWINLTLANNIFWGSIPVSSHVIFPSEYSVCGSLQTPSIVNRNNLIEGGLTDPLGVGVDNFDLDPMFVDNERHIGFDSPCVDAGTSTFAGDFDLDGNPRVAGVAIDVGAYETQPDCNSNGTPDDIDLSSGNSADCNANNVPDECDIATSPELDCNANGVIDLCDILPPGTSNDCNGNFIPDECEIQNDPSLDCNDNDSLDVCEIFSGTSEDCNGNWIPDECEPDCDNDGQVDSCQIASGSTADCDFNGIPDICELIDNDCNANGTLDACDVLSGNFNDCDGDFIPDECQLIGNDCDTNGIPDQCDAIGGDCNLNNVPDYCELVGNDCDSNAVPDDCQSDCNGDLIPDACEPDCDADGVPDECETAPEEGDCNANGLPDNCDITAGTSTDLNHNLIPDECDPDCNANGLPDFIDIAYGVSPDCNGNEVPDECDLSGGSSDDCNVNGVPDECDVSDGTSSDCNNNIVPDECEDDCNRNGVPDDCDIASGTSLDLNEDGHPDECKPDCNGNGVPDYIDILFNVSEDCDLNGIPDECEPDCNQNGVLDLCDLSDGTSFDCDANSIPDECDPDCDQDGTPDNCQSFTDCNANGSPDECDILSQASDDCDGNNIPDECDLADGADDCDENGALDICQIAADPNADQNGNGTLDTCECFATNFCEGVLNSSGSAGSIGITGSTILSQNDLTLTATGVPANQFGVFYYGPNQVNRGAGTPFGEGKRCVGGQTVRLNVVNTGPNSLAQAAIDNTAHPHSQNLQPGSTWHFQFWFRDIPGGPFGWNLTDALTATFCP